MQALEVEEMKKNTELNKQRMFEGTTYIGLRHEAIWKIKTKKIRKQKQNTGQDFPVQLLKIQQQQQTAIEEGREWDQDRVSR